MASALREHITGVWGQNPQRGPEAEPLVRGSPLKLKDFRFFNVLRRAKFGLLSRISR